MSYVESGYVEEGYFEGDVSLDADSVLAKKVNFVVDKKNTSDTSIKALLLSKVGENYEDDVNIIFGKSLKLATKEGGLFKVTEIVGGISQEQLDAIDAKIPTAQSILSAITPSLPTAQSIKSLLLSDEGFMSSIAQMTLENMSVSLVAQNGTEIASSLIYDEEKNAYVLDYDTSLLDGTEYTIELTLSGN